MRDWNYRHHQKCRGGKCRTGNIGTMLQGVENAELELSAPNCRGGKCRTGNIGTMLQGVENAGPSSYGKPNTYLLRHTQHDRKCGHLDFRG